MGNQIRVTRALDGNVISAKTPASTALVRGQIVQTKGSTVAGLASSINDAIQFELATGTKGFLLTRDVLNATSVPLANLFQIFPPGGTPGAGTAADLLSPELAGAVVSAQAVQEYEVEGDTDLILTTAVAKVAAVGVAIGTDPLLTSAAAHGYVVGQLITITGMTGSGATTANASWTVATVPSALTFTVGASLVTATNVGVGGTSTPTQILTSATAIGSRLTSFKGKVALATATTQETFGYLRGVLAADDSANTIAARLLIEVNP